MRQIGSSPQPQTWLRQYIFLLQSLRSYPKLYESLLDHYDLRPFKFTKKVSMEHQVNSPLEVSCRRCPPPTNLIHYGFSFAKRLS